MTDSALLSLVEGAFTNRLVPLLRGTGPERVGGRNCFFAAAWLVEMDFGPIPTAQWDRAIVLAQQRSIFRMSFDGGYSSSILLWLTRRERRAAAKAAQRLAAARRASA